MSDMTFEEFKNEIAENIKDFLPGQYEDCMVNLNTVQKNNATLDALTIVSPDSNVSPTIYLNDFYQDYRDGQSMDLIMQRIADIRATHETSVNFDSTQVTDFDQVKDKISARMVGIEGNDELLSQRPHVEMADLAVTFAINLGEGTEGLASIPITNELMGNWDVSVEELFNLAKENQAELSPSSFKSMNEVMMEMMVPDLMDEMGVDRETAEVMLSSMVPEDDKMYVLTNEQKLNGATALLDEKMMADIAEKVGDDYFILPSSIHEVLIVPESNGIRLNELEQMVQEVNANEVAPQDRLSDHVYKYDNDTHEVFRADKEAEHLMAKENAKEEAGIPLDAIADMPKDKENSKVVDISDKKAGKANEEKASLKERLEDKKREVKSVDKKSPEKALNKSPKKEQALYFPFLIFKAFL